MWHDELQYVDDQIPIHFWICPPVTSFFRPFADVIEHFDFDLIGILLPLDIGRVWLALKGGRYVLKKHFLPVVEVDDTHAVLVADLRDRYLLNEVLPQNRNFLLRC